MSENEVIEVIVEKKKVITEKDSVFRGTWQPTIHKPVFGQYQFLPTPLPQEPKKKKLSIAEAPKEPEVEKAPESPKTRSKGPPEGVDVEFLVLDREKEYRACIAQNGACYNNLGDIIGFINFETLEAGSVSEMYLGGVVENKFNNVIQVRDDEDELVGYVDLGTSTIRDRQGGTIADFQSGGIVKHSNGTYLGQFEGARGFHNTRELSLYLMLIDPGMCSDVSG
jgi:hypothetical protein